MDITDPLVFPRSAQRWQLYVREVAAQGLADTEHYGEVYPDTMEAFFTLLQDTSQALAARGTPEYDSVLNKIPVEWRPKLNYIFQMGAEFTVQMFRARRGGENMRDLKKNHSEMFEDRIKNFKYWKHIRSEKDKNHNLGTHAALNGCIPYTDFLQWNPGKFLKRYISHLPEDGECPLFPRPRLPSNNFNPHHPGTLLLYTENPGTLGHNHPAVISLFACFSR